MIRINLASGSPQVAPVGIVYSRENSYSPAEVQRHGLLRLIILLIGPLGLWAYQQQVLPDLVTARNVKSAHLQELRQFNVRKEKSVQEIKRFKEDEQKIQARISYLDRLAKNRLREIKVLDLVQQVIPEKVWLTKVQDQNGKLTLSGMALSDFDISAFMEFLSKSVYFLDVNLSNSAEMIYDGLNLKKFEIVCTMEKAAQ